jgi:hypothetical protein
VVDWEAKKEKEKVKSLVMVEEAHEIGGSGGQLHFLDLRIGHKKLTRK